MDQTSIDSGKPAAIISYLTIFGVLIAYFMNNEKKNVFAAFHIRQALGLWLTFFALGLVISNFDSWMASGSLYLAFGVLFMYGFFTAVAGKTNEVPLVGKFYQNIFSGLGQ
ncbi:MAG: hypothetical protein KJO49_05030 [Bacteroidia bacterium]|nr:hypothetical protein [Bacteroidia bacterium]MBT8268125.1 hypothetical protein [Bacteroidia bacterium]NNF81482.1 hypothetical protein [Flavobacteriaceae bacterium]NNK71488.1 hypothetical protein [Flavobacteriaceae bacterium]NNL81662.1 hypothetical protein [Flavobacteriaceae bacterium]